MNAPFSTNALARRKTVQDLVDLRDRNDRGLIVVTCYNPETGEHYRAAGGDGGFYSDRRPGLAGYMGAEGPAHEVADFAARVRATAQYIKDEEPGKRGYI